jgi:hypothetical protein
VIRDFLCGSIEIVAMEHMFDGLVLLSSCDSIIPAELMAAARLDIPSVVVTGCPMLPGRYRGRDIVMSQLDEAFLGGMKQGSRAEILEMEEVACQDTGHAPDGHGLIPCKSNRTARYVVRFSDDSAVSSEADGSDAPADKSRLVKRPDTVWIMTRQALLNAIIVGWPSRFTSTAASARCPAESTAWMILIA